MKDKILLAYNPDKTIGSVYSLDEKENKKLVKKLTISRSAIDQGWTNPNEKVLSFVDHGNGITFSFKDQIVDVDYEDFALLYFVMNRVYDTKINETFRVFSMEEEK